MLFRHRKVNRLF